jgi:hypothetical protein
MTEKTISEQINELAAALAQAQGAMENAAKNKVNPHFKSRYADLAAVLDAIRIPLSANGLSTVQTMQIGEHCIVLRTTLLHSSGQFISTEYPIAMALKPQEMGSAITYGRRYSLAALVGIAQDDDDANAAANTLPVRPNVQSEPRQESAEIDQAVPDDSREQYIAACRSLIAGFPDNSTVALTWWNDPANHRARDDMLLPPDRLELQALVKAKLPTKEKTEPHEQAR